MSQAVEITAIAAPTVLALAGLGTAAVAREWVNLTVTVSVKAIPAAKRRPRTAVDVTVIPGTVEQPAAPSIAAARRTG